MWNVTAADGYQHQLIDDRGEPMGPIQQPGFGGDETGELIYYRFIDTPTAVDN